MKILVISPSWLGDFVMMQSFLKRLLAIDNNTIIDVVTPLYCLPLAKFMPEINKAIILDNRHGKLDFFKRKKLALSLRNKYDKAIVLPLSWKSSLVSYFAKINIRVGYLGECRWGLLNNIYHLDTNLSMVDRYLNLADNKNNSFTWQDKPVLQVIDKPKKLHNKILALCPGAEYGKAKCWPIEYFIKLAQIMAQKNWHIWVFGNKKDMQKGQQVVDGIENAKNFAGITDLEKSIELLSVVDTVVCNDSGLMHIACALDIKVIAIYGSSSEIYTPPLSKKATAVSIDIACRPCFKKTCIYNHYKCLSKISVDKIVQKIEV